MPLVSELVFGGKSSPPEYTMSYDKENKCNWSIIFETPRDGDFSFPKEKQLNLIQQFEYLEKSIKSVLDETQMKGIENFLKHRVSIIQVSYNVRIVS